MKVFLTIFVALFLASCSSKQVTKEQILAKHLDGKKLEVTESERKPAANKDHNHHFKMAVEQLHMHQLIL